MKRKQLEIPAVSQSSVASVVSEASNRQQIADNFQQNQNLIANRGANITIIMQFLKQNLIKLLIILLLLSLSIWLLLYIFSQNYKISRVPSSLTADGFFSQVSQIVAQPESDYQSFKMYQKMQQLAIKTTKQNRQPSQQQYQQFDHLTFYQLYDIYKIMTTIQLAKSYFPTKQQKDSQTKQYDKQIDQINFTQYFQEVVDQHKCSSCYSFPVTATIQFMYKKHYNITIKLSEQQLIDCADQSQQNGCEDGNITKAFQYVEKVGLVQQSEYPYESIAGKSFKCKKDLIEQNITKYKISGFKTLTPRKCQEIKQQLLKNRTVAVMMNAQNLVRYQIGQTFTDCSKKGLNHAVTIVGFTKSDQWIVRNSWGKNWAEKGYFKIGRGNTCGVCSHGIVPLLKLDENQNVIKLQGDQNDQ